jgi:hypothetical protein
MSADHWRTAFSAVVEPAPLMVPADPAYAGAETMPHIMKASVPAARSLRMALSQAITDGPQRLLR